MTLLVGRLPGSTDDATGAVTLGLRLARAWSESLVVCTVLSPGEAAGPDTDPGLDADAGDGLELSVTHITDRSVPGGLARAARAHSASVIVLGDGPQRPGTVGARLARAADLPVALAGRSTATGPITRVTCGFGGARGSDAVLARAHGFAHRSGATLRVASFGTERPSAVPPEVGLDAEADVVEAWREQIGAAQRDALALAGVAPGPVVETLAVAGPTVGEAVASIGWDDGDLLVVGASPHGAAARVLFGDPAAAILDAAPVPVVVVPGAPPEGFAM